MLFSIPHINIVKIADLKSHSALLCDSALRDFRSAISKCSPHSFFIFDYLVKKKVLKDLTLLLYKCKDTLYTLLDVGLFTVLHLGTPQNYFGTPLALGVPTPTLGTNILMGCDAAQ